MGKKTMFYIGTYSLPIVFGTGNIFLGKGEGIYLIELDTETGKITDGRLVSKAANPSFLAISPCRKYLYAVNELKSYDGKQQGSVSTFRIKEDTGDLELINVMPTGGTDPCHAIVSYSGRYLAVSNFMSGSLCLYTIESDGSLSPDFQLIQHEGSSIDAIRQQGPHTHAAMFDRNDRFVYVSDLGLDNVIIYRLNSDEDQLLKVNSYESIPGSGPRYCETHPSLNVFYLVNELDSSLSVLKADSENGRLSLMQNVSTVEDSYKSSNTGAVLHVSPDGRFVYASNRGHNSIAIFSVEHQGHLKYTGFEPSGGKTPRHFTINSYGDFLLAANQDSDNISVFKINKMDGMLENCYQIDIPTPVCICEFVPPKR